MLRRSTVATAVAILAAVTAGPVAAGPNQDDVSGADLDDFILDVHATILDIETGVMTTQSAVEVTITLEADVFFDFDEHQLRPDAIEVLEEVAEQIREDGVDELEVVGHTDSDGSDDYNQGLSERRAASVEAFLAGELNGVNITSLGLGESQPVATNETDVGRALNRRVEISYPR